jgi:hypothetical protein
MCGVVLCSSSVQAVSFGFRFCMVPPFFNMHVNDDLRYDAVYPFAYPSGAYPSFYQSPVRHQMASVQKVVYPPQPVSMPSKASSYGDTLYSVWMPQSDKNP